MTDMMTELTGYKTQSFISVDKISDADCLDSIAQHATTTEVRANYDLTAKLPGYKSSPSHCSAADQVFHIRSADVNYTLSVVTGPPIGPGTFNYRSSTNHGPASCSSPDYEKLVYCTHIK